MISYTLRHAARALLTLLGLVVAVGLVASAGNGCGATPCLDAGTFVSWLGRLARLDLGRTADGGSVAAAIAGAAPASALLLAGAALCIVLLGWGGGLLLSVIERRGERRHGPTVGDGQSAGTPERARRGVAGPRAGRAVGRGLAAVLEICQGLPTFWLGGVLVALFAVGLGWLPPGGIVALALPAFGTPEYLSALGAQPAALLGDLLAHLLLPALTLALAGAATPLRLIASILPAELRAPHARAARGAGLSPRRLLWRAARPAMPVVLGGSSGDLPLLASALVLVEYLFGWPGLGLLAYHAARQGDAATLEALALLAGCAVVVAGLLADLAAAWADPRRRGRFDTLAGVGQGWLLADAPSASNRGPAGSRRSQGDEDG